MIIVNFATKGFQAGQLRLAASVYGLCDIMTLNDYKQIGSPSHQISPYEFKVHSIAYAMKQHPKENIFLWCDASLFRVGKLSKIEKVIQEDGYFMEEAGHYVRDWCNDHTRNYFKLKPEESEFKMFSAGLLGLNRQSVEANDFFNQWKDAAKAGCFKGYWTDHRHDMTCGSIIAERMGLKYQRGGSFMAYLGEGYEKPDPGVIFHLQGI
jgi:hypothetical protein